MSKIKKNQIQFNDSNFIVKIDSSEENKEVVLQEELVENQAQSLIDEANIQAQEIINNAQKRAQEIIDNAIEQQKEMTEEAKKELEDNKNLQIQEAEAQIEELRIQKAKEGYEEGHKDGLEKVKEELEDKIINFDKFIMTQYEIKDKILKSSTSDIVSIIINIARKVLLKEVNSETIEKIVKNTIRLLENKENINVILSEKYAKLLFELQSNSLFDGAELDFSSFKQYDNFNVVYNQKMKDDTIIVENLKERFDASINNQLDIIVRDIYNSIEQNEIELGLEKNEDF